MSAKSPNTPDSIFNAEYIQVILGILQIFVAIITLWQNYFFARTIIGTAH